MKKIVVFVFGTLCCLACKKNADSVVTPTVSIIPESAVPAPVLASFNVSFGSSTEREWHHTSDDKFICQFNMNDQRHEADFDEHGTESEHNVICINTAVSAVVLNAFSTNFPSDLADEWNLTNENTWKVEFMRGSVKWEVTFSLAGDIIKSEHN